MLYAAIACETCLGFAVTGTGNNQQREVHSTRWGSTGEARARLVQVQEPVARLEQDQEALNVPGPRTTVFPVEPLASRWLVWRMAGR